MSTTATLPELQLRHPMNLAGKDFVAHRYEYYRWLRENAPVYRGKLFVMNFWFVSRYADCVDVLKDPRFVRNRSTATGGGSRLPFPVPRSVALVARSMIVEDDPEHKRLRGLVHKAFTPAALKRLETRIERLTHELLDEAEPQGSVDLVKAYSLPIPVTVIKEMMGVSDEDMPKFRDGLKVLTDGMSGWNVIRSMFWDLRRTRLFVKDLIDRKRAEPQDDILTGLIQAEEAGEKLSEDELIGMVFLLVFSGFETTVHLITNAVLTLLEHPEQLERLRSEPALMESAVEEILRYRGPIHATKPMYATEDVTLHGQTIPKAAPLMPLLGAANFDPEVFEDPDTFDVARTPNKHLAFGHGIHFCLGAPLARMETRIALTNLLERNPNLRLAVDPSDLKLQTVPMWHRYESLPVSLG